MDIYENPALLPHGEATQALEAALQSTDTGHDPNSVLVALGLYDDDRLFVERWCRRIVRDSSDLWLVATASLCLGHVARRFRALEPESIAVVRELVGRTDLDGRVRDALEDVTFFLADSPER